MCTTPVATRKIGYAAHEHMKKDVFVHNNYQNYENFPALRTGLTNFIITLYMFKRAPKNTIF